MIMPLRGWLMMAAPYVAVLLGMYVLKHAFISVLIYHLLIVFWAVYRRGRPKALPLLKGWFLLGGLGAFVAALLVVPVLWFLMPIMIRPDTVLVDWFADYGISGSMLWLFAIYFGLVHPLLEEVHWGPLRQSVKPLWCVHLAFAFYHVLVLSLLLTVPWAILAGCVLCVTSYVWGLAEKRFDGSLVPVLSHTLADFAIVSVTVWMAVKGVA